MINFTDARRITAAALRGSGYAVATATTAKQARSVFHRRQPAAMIFDPSLSWGNAPDSPRDAVSAIRCLTEIPLLVVFASADECDNVSLRSRPS
jgi:DNA-binding response OmpR family regulator